MPQPEALVLQETTSVEIMLDQVQTFINSMVLLVRSEELSGLNPWIYETVGALTSEQKTDHDLVTIGVHQAILPTRYWKDLPTFLAHLESADPVMLRDKVLNAYINFEPCEEAEETIEADNETLLADVDFFLKYLKSRFGEEYIDPVIEIKAHELLNNPVQMQKLIVSHLNFMWEEFFKSEWERIEPMLNDAVMAFEEIDFSDMSRAEAIKYITGRDITGECWKKEPPDANRLVFVPSAHNGPYLGRFHYKNTLGIIFGARLPKDTEVHAPDLSRNEITIRLGALADDVRLHILKLIAEDGELRSQEIMDRLELSQSAASRHLKQLSATGYVIERRCSGAKCYSLNEERVQDTLRAVAAFLLCD
jgi:DNA-binding transcriptional ArsR family regulator